MEREKFIQLASELSMRGYGDELDWQRYLQPCEDANTFWLEACWVILNSGMKEQIARKIWDKIKDSWRNGGKAHDVFGHKGKSDAIEYIRENRMELFKQYQQVEDKLTFLQTLPFIGSITKYHLAKNLGVDCVKPDRHLVRVAAAYDMTPDELCEKLSKETGEKKCVIDIIIWRACNLGLLPNGFEKAEGSVGKKQIHLFGDE